MNSVNATYANLTPHLSSYNTFINESSKNLTSKLLISTITPSKTIKTTQNYNLKVNYFVARKSDLRHKKRLQPAKVKSHMRRSIHSSNTSDNKNLSHIFSLDPNIIENINMRMIRMKMPKISFQNIWDVITHYQNPKTGRVTKNREELALLSGYSESTVKRAIAYFNEMGWVVLHEQKTSKFHKYSRRPIYIAFEVKAAGQKRPTNISKLISISNITKKEGSFKKEVRKVEKSKERKMPRNEQEEKELINKLYLYPANKKRLDDLGWEKSLSMKKAYHCFLRNNKIPKYLQDKFDTILWTEETINVYLPTWMKGTLERQKIYGNKFIYYHVRDEYKLAKSNGFIKLEAKDKRDSYIEINNRRLREQALLEHSTKNDFQTIFQKPIVKQIKKLSEAETLAILAKEGIKNILEN